MDVYIHVRYGTALKFRNTRWIISEQRVLEPFLRLPLLEFLGLNIYDILATSAGRS